MIAVSIVSRPNATCIVIAIARSIFANVRKVNNAWQKRQQKWQWKIILSTRK